MTRLEVDRLRVEGFRGITGVLDLDLRSPLTLLYAANGTGKTSVCEAVEWLVTGVVDRLSTATGFDPSVLRSRFKPTVVPRVEAELRVNAEPFFIERSPDGARGGGARSTAKSMIPSELLERLAPRGATSESRHRSTLAQRQQWLRGTRMLTVDSLAALLDTDKDTVERRGRVFADLLGVRRQFDAKDRLRRYGEALQPEEGRLDAEVRSRQRDLDGMLAERAVGAPETTSSVEWGKAEELLGLPNGEGGEERAQVVAGEVARRGAVAQAMRQALGVVEREPVEAGVLRQRLDDEVTRGQAAATASEAARVGLAALRDSLDASSRQAQAATRANDGVTEVTENLSRLLDALSTAVEALDPADGLPPGTALGPVRARIAEAGLTARRRGQLTSEVARLMGETPDAAKRVGERRDVEDAIARLVVDLPDADARQRLASEVAAAGDAVERAKARVTAESEPVRRLQAASEAFLNHRHDGSDCPVCGWDWGARLALDAAIRTVVDRMPTVLADARRDLARAEGVLAEAKARVSDADDRVGRFAALEAERADLAARASAYGRRLQAVGVDPDAPDPVMQLRRIRARLDVAKALSEVEDACSRGLGPLGLSFDASLPLPEAMEALQVEADEKCLTELRTAATHHTLAEDLVASIAESERELAGQEVIREESRGLEAELRGRLNALAAAWRVLNPGGSEPASGVVDMAERLGREEASLSQARARLAAGTAAAEQASQRERLTEIEAELDRLKARLEDVRGKRRVASRAMDAMQAHYLQAGRRQLEALIRTVNPLFARMHANKVFDSIDLGDGDDLLRWRSSAGDREFDPSQDFSQGQRQDLALALFIARAQGLGGTFFLDEPVIHLDDHNRVGLLDVLRATVLSQQGGTRLVVTTSSRSIAMHLMEKFGRVAGYAEGAPPLRVYEIKGNGRSGVDAASVYPRVGWASGTAAHGQVGA